MSVLEQCKASMWYSNRRALGRRCAKGCESKLDDRAPVGLGAAPAVGCRTTGLGGSEIARAFVSRCGSAQQEQCYGGEEWAKVCSHGATLTSQCPQLAERCPYLSDFDV